MDGETTFRETVDPEGRRVVLERTTWREKIVRDHPEVSSFADEVLRAVAVPDYAVPDPSFESRCRYYLHSAGPSRWLMVVVSYEQVPARIVSAFGNRKDPGSWSG
jgi:hypothetical protein